MIAGIQSSAQVAQQYRAHVNALGDKDIVVSGTTVTLGTVPAPEIEGK